MTHARPQAPSFDSGSTLLGIARAFLFVATLSLAVVLITFARLTKLVSVQDISTWEFRLASRFLGFHVRVFGKPSTAVPTVFVANHASYLDIPVLGSVVKALFVAKADVSQWPVFGWLTRIHNTVFVERRSIRAKEQGDILRDHLEKYHSLLFFPEGTSTDGLRVLPFKSSLFSPVEKPLPDGRAITVQAISVTCSGLNGAPIGRARRLSYAWVGDVTLMPHLWNAFRQSSFTIDVIFHEPTTIAEWGNRKQLAEHCHKQVAEGVEKSLAGRHAPIIKLTKRKKS